MAGSLVAIASEHQEIAMMAIRDKWEVQFARFFKYPTPSVSSSCSFLVPRPNNRRFCRSKGTWKPSSSSLASLQLATTSSSSEVILTVQFQGKVCEEHYISKLHFSRPQVSCISGFPARGTRVVFASFIDSEGELQKFAVRFSTNSEADAFINVLEEIFKDANDYVFPSSDFRSDISSQSEFMSSSRPSHRVQEDLSMMTPISMHTPQMPKSGNYEAEQYSQPEFISSKRPRFRLEDRSSIISTICDYSPQMPESINYEVEQHSAKQETRLNHNFEGILPALPPSFTTLLTNCCSEAELAAAGQQSAPEEVELKSQILKYMEDSSFQEMLVKVEKVIDELGDDLSL